MISFGMATIEPIGTPKPVWMSGVASALRTLGVPYSEEDIAGASDAVKGKSEMDALVAYLQVLGTAVKNKR